jgi:hypothetical protein
MGKLAVVTPPFALTVAGATGATPILLSVSTLRVPASRSTAVVTPFSVRNSAAGPAVLAGAAAGASVEPVELLDFVDEPPHPARRRTPVPSVARIAVRRLKVLD